MPGQAVIVVSFPEPENEMELAEIIKSIKEPFIDRTDVKMHMGINNVADEVIAIFNPLHEGEDNGENHADGT